MVLQKEYVLLTSSAISINITVSVWTKQPQKTTCITTMLVENVKLSYLRWYKVIDLKIPVYKRNKSVQSLQYWSTKRECKDMHLCH